MLRRALVLAQAQTVPGEVAVVRPLDEIAALLVVPLSNLPIIVVAQTTAPPSVSVVVGVGAVLVHLQGQAVLVVMALAVVAVTLLGQEVAAGLFCNGMTEQTRRRRASTRELRSGTDLAPPSRLNAGCGRGSVRHEGDSA